MYIYILYVDMYLPICVGSLCHPLCPAVFPVLILPDAAVGSFSCLPVFPVLFGSCFFFVFAAFHFDLPVFPFREAGEMAAHGKVRGILRYTVTAVQDQKRSFIFPNQLKQ